MAGGAGTRFWPISTADTPKQFVQVADTGKNFLQLTAQRLSQVIPMERTIVVTNRKYAVLVKESLPQIPPENILEEPYNRDTAPCVALATYTILQRDPNAVMVVVPADHFIMDTEKFQGTISHIVKNIPADGEALVTLGITPTRPDTNYGYIQTTDVPTEDCPIKVKTFTEKPDASLAEVFVQSGEFLWNSGIFVWRAEVIKREFEKHLPHMVELFKGWETALGSSMQADFLEKVYADVQKISIDYAIMERTDKAWVYPVSMGWYDVGTWESMYSFIPGKDADGNASNVPFLSKDSKGNLLLSTTGDKLIAVCGLDNYAVVDTGKALLICPRDDKKFREFIVNLSKSDYEKYR